MFDQYKNKIYSQFYTNIKCTLSTSYESHFFFPVSSPCIQNMHIRNTVDLLRAASANSLLKKCVCDSLHSYCSLMHYYSVLQINQPALGNHAVWTTWYDVRWQSGFKSFNMCILLHSARLDLEMLEGLSLFLNFECVFMFLIYICSFSLTNLCFCHLLWICY